MEGPNQLAEMEPMCHAMHTIEWTFFPGEDRLKERNA
jgi:hypothetical protein